MTNHTLMVLLIVVMLLCLTNIMFYFFKSKYWLCRLVLNSYFNIDKHDKCLLIMIFETTVLNVTFETADLITEQNLMFEFVYLIYNTKCF